MESRPSNQNFTLAAHPGRVLLALALAAVLLPGSAFPQTQEECAHDEGNPAAMPSIEPDATVHALIILARFPEDDDTPSTGCGSDPWPYTDTDTPSWAFDLIDDSVANLTDGSLSDFFYLMSDGEHELLGEVYDHVVTVSSACSYNDYADANTDAIMAVDADPDFYLGGSRFDADGDGFIDFVFVVYRDRFAGACPDPIGFAGTSELGFGFSDFHVGVVNGDSTDAKKVTRENGATLAPAAALRGFHLTRRVAAHEYFHDILPHNTNNLANNHTRSLGDFGIMDGTRMPGVQNGMLMSAAVRDGVGWMNPSTVIDIPAGDLMPGDTTRVTLKDVGKHGSQGYAVVISPVPWQSFILECRDSTGSSYTDPDPLICPDMGGAGFSGLLIQHKSEKREIKFSPPTICEPIPGGIPVAGWWKTAGQSNVRVEPQCGGACDIDGGTTWLNENYPPSIDVEVATGMFDTTTTSHHPDPVVGWDYMSQFENSPFPQSSADLFRPGEDGVSIFAPYTNPSTNLYWESTPPEDYDDRTNCEFRQDQNLYSGLSFYNIEWEVPPGNNGSGEIGVTIRYDGPTAPTGLHPLPVNMSWEGLVQLTSDVEVPSGASLTVAPATRVIAAASRDYLGQGRDDASVEVLVKGTITLEGDSTDPILWTSSRDGTFEHFVGVADANGPVLGFGEAVPAAAGDWFGLRVASGGQVVLQNADGDEIRYGRAAVNWEDATPPDFGALDTGIEFTTNRADVGFDRDLLVANGTTSTVPAGLALGFEQDVKWEVKGTLDVQGTSGEPVKLTSLNDTPAKGDWGGIEFDDQTELTASSVRHADFEYPTFAVSVDSVSGNFFQCSFTETEDGDIYVPGDTRIPPGFEWDLIAPTRVVAANSDAHSRGEDTTRVEVVFNGALTVLGSASDRVVFTSETQDTTFGNAWHGLTILGNGFAGVGEADIDYADFSYAAYPLTFLWADDPVVRRSYFHHYNQEAITDAGSDATIEDNDIWRGNMDPTTDPPFEGLVGIHISTSFGTYADNRVFHQMEKGIWADFPKSYCEAQTSPQPQKVLLIRDNDVIGDRTTFPSLSAHGIDVSWACKEQDVTVRGNNVQNWPQVGVRVRQSSDVLVDCNCVMGNSVGLRHKRNFRLPFTSEDGHSRIKDCRLAGNDFANVLMLEGPDSNNSSGLYGGKQGDAQSGDNVINLGAVGSFNWRLDVWEWSRKDTAHKNAWRDFAGATLPDSVSIRNFNFLNNAQDQEIHVAGFITSLSDSCVSLSADCSIPTPPSSQRHSGPRVEAALVQGGDEGVTGAKSMAPELPTALEFHPPRPNPTRGSVEFVLDIPPGITGAIQVTVYDVAGRRVAGILDRSLQAGRYEIQWSLENEGGERVSSGIYFATMVVGEERSVRRVVVLN